jgi:polyphosphate kinase
MAPLKDSGLRRRVFNILRTYLVDNVKARELQADGRYVRVKAGMGQHLVDAQVALLNEGSSPDTTADKRVSADGRYRHLTLVRESSAD